jgi:hypothetical protein
MVRISSVLPLVCLIAASANAAPVRKPAKPAAAKPKATSPIRIDPDLISEGKEAILVDHLKPEATTVVLFYRPADADERDLADILTKRAKEEPRLGLRFVRLTAVDTPIAKQYEVEATPAAFVYDRNKNLLGRARTYTEIGELAGKGIRVARLKWVDEGDPSAPEVYRRFGGGRGPVPEILKTMSLRPEIMEAIGELSRYHFSDGFLNRRTHEMIASYVSALNRCKY